MEIKVLEIIWEKSQSVYRQGIKGEKNFRHREPKNFIMVTEEYMRIFRESCF